MFKNSNNFTKEEIIRLYEQSELSEIINDDTGKYKSLNKSGSVPVKFPFLYTMLSAGAVISFITLFKRNKLF